MVALLVSMSVMAVMLSVALPVWRTAAQREREAELIFRGEQYAQAIELYSRRFGGYPTTIDVLLADSQPFLRKRYTDPMTDGEFQVVYLGQMAPQQPGMPGQPQGRGGQPGAPGVPAPRQPGAPASPFTTQPGGGAGPIIGVVSRSTQPSLRLYNGRGRYNEWMFVATEATQDPGVPGGAQTPGMPAGRGGGIGQQPGPPGPGREGMPVPPRGGGPGRGPGGRGIGPGIQIPGRQGF
jgi:type II secretory pathway pseudopilin PulG